MAAKKTHKVKCVYFFGNGKAEGSAKMKNLLGGKGSNLAEMTNLGIPVPPGFTITTETCIHFYENNKKYPAGFMDEVEKNLKKKAVVVADNVGIFEKSMNDYLEYVRNSGRYKSRTIQTELEFKEGVKDAIEISIKIF